MGLNNYTSHNCMCRLVISGLILAARIWDPLEKKRKRFSDTQRGV